MSENRSKAIIGVFGGDDAEAVRAAKMLGGVIARHKQILLTGGTRPGNESVKQSAIAGVGSSQWVGVERADTIGHAESDKGFVIFSNIGHRRNYLEACLCDAAVGLKGGDGTISEVVFALALRKPVALVGDHWRENGSLDGAERPRVLKSMVERAFYRVGTARSGRPDLDQLLNEAAINAGLEQLPPYGYFPINAAGDAIGWIMGQLASCPKAGHFPRLAGYEDVAAAYHNWLRVACDLHLPRADQPSIGGGTTPEAEPLYGLQSQ
jgi:predicted Rossmann-fold nucleotide-binding protein